MIILSYQIINNYSFTDLLTKIRIKKNFEIRKTVSLFTSI